MRRIGLASLITLLAFGANAADVQGSRSPALTEVVPPGVGWTGVYAGLHAGYGFANTSISIPGLFGFSGLGANGWLVGGKVGADYQVAQRWVAGILAEGNLQGIDTTVSAGGLTVARVSGDLRWAIRGRLGFLLTPETLVYATAGWSQGRTTFSLTGLGSAGLLTSGWQIGGGIETRLSGNVFLHAEYVHTFTNSIGQFAPLVVRPTSGTVRVGLSYRFGMGQAHPTFAAAGRRDWSGFFAGVQGGYGFGNTSLSVPGVFEFTGIGSQGFFGGVLAGYDHHFAGTAVVAGIEADASLSAINTTLQAGGPSASVGSDWNVGARARLGYVIGGSIMPYVAAGYGWTHIRASGLGVGFGETMGGLQLAAGVETMITPNVTLRAEYVHQFNSSRPLIPGLLNYRTDSGRARVSVSWKFGGDAAVIARY
ncbi:MAG: ropB2 [Xanthobacteraceae bacterium]|nr:MAG: ropB2 [Xanthobacteraceae bacterium]